MDNDPVRAPSRTLAQPRARAHDFSRRVRSRRDEATPHRRAPSRDGLEGLDFRVAALRFDRDEIIAGDRITRALPGDFSFANTSARVFRRDEARTRFRP